jgi:hypothetical protein
MNFRQATGQKAKKSGSAFENKIAETFPAYAAAGRAYLDLLSPPMSPCGMRGRRPVFVQAGKAPFDVYGYTRKGVIVVAELKTTGERNPSLPIIADGKHASGLAAHQLAALAQVARCGGIARLVWNNGGEVRALQNEEILVAAAVYEQATSYSPAVGAKSIRWERFATVFEVSMRGTDGLVQDWLNEEGK